jgi:hypothetical protein
MTDETAAFHRRARGLGGVMISEVIVVVPEGLAYDRVLRRAIAKPSFVGMAVLTHVVEQYADRRILIAPGNGFGSAWSEHAIMATWLLSKGCATVETPPLAAKQYLDTWGNAVELRRWLAQCYQWPLGPIRLIAGFRHVRRARLCFMRNGFSVTAVDPVPYRAEGVFIVPRLFFYNRPWLHRAYEAAALLRDRVRSLPSFDRSS